MNSQQTTHQVIPETVRMMRRVFHLLRYPSKQTRILMLPVFVAMLLADYAMLRYEIAARQERAIDAESMPVSTPELLNLDRCGREEASNFLRGHPGVVLGLARYLAIEQGCKDLSDARQAPVDVRQQNAAAHDAQLAALAPHDGAKQ